MTREASRRYAEKNRELLARKRRDARAADPDKARASALKTSRKQAGCVNPSGETRDGPCEICGSHAAPLHFDHNHETGEFRGWLCGPCNRAIGLMKDDPLRLELAAKYLRRSE